MSKIDSRKQEYKDVPKYGKSGVVIENGRFWKITGIDSNEFYARDGKDQMRGMTKYLHPYGKTGTIKQYDGIKSFYIYKDGTDRKDLPKDVKHGTPYNEIDTDYVKGLREANLTNHIVQIGNKDGGFVINDLGGEVEVKLKSGGIKRVSKTYLHLVKIHYTKKYHKRLWLKYDSGNALPMDKSTLPMSQGEAFRKYMELKDQLDPLYARSDDFRVYSRNSKISSEMMKLWGRMSETHRKKATRK